MPKPVLLDFFCGAGGASMGYHRAGFRVIGFDIEPQPHYPFEFHQNDVVFDLDSFVAMDEGAIAIHASPPCQRHSTLRTGLTRSYDDLVDDTRNLLRDIESMTPIVWVIENVMGAPLVDPVKVCGSAVGCIDDDGYMRRHRMFESNVPLVGSGCRHRKDLKVYGVYGDLGLVDRCNNPNRPNHGTKASMSRARRLMGIDWGVTNRELTEAIPPAYTEFIGRQLLSAYQTGHL